MALNWIFAGFFILSFAFAIVRFFMGDTEVFSDMMKSTFDNAEKGINLCVYYAGIITLFQGLMNIGQQGGVIQKLAKVMNPFFAKIFPDIPKDHPALGSILLNFSANALNLGNAATPFGLKAMEQMQELNPQKDTASNSQIMFLVLNTSGLTLIPVAIMALRNKFDAADPTMIFIPVLLTTFCSTLVGLTITSLIQKINLFNRVILLYLGVLMLIMSFFISLPFVLSPDMFKLVLGSLGSFILLLVFVYFIVNGLRGKINVYEAFIDGAKGGVKTGLKIAPYLIGILVAIGLFTTSGSMDFIMMGIRKIVVYVGLNPAVADALPVALIRPLSGGGAEGMAISVFESFGTDSFSGQLASLFQGSSETTFYVLAVYFGSVGVSKTRYAVKCGLLADLAGVIAAIFFSYLFIF